MPSPGLRPMEHLVLGFLTQWNILSWVTSPNGACFVLGFLPPGISCRCSQIGTPLPAVHLFQTAFPPTYHSKAQGSQTCSRPEANPAAGVGTSAVIIQFNHKTISPSALGAWCASFPFPTKRARAVKSGWFTVI